ncbi:hypothetical protein VDF77_20695, partial [Xanthomonas campestris pv. raphani]|uniref:hypothetical protein n=1 Tax=Xanthomonas campestris TaxID=339 RepID=UPI002B23CA73
MLLLHVMHRKQGAYGALFFCPALMNLWPGVANTMGSASCIDHTGGHHCVGAPLGAMGVTGESPSRP